LLLNCEWDKPESWLASLGRVLGGVPATADTGSLQGGATGHRTVRRRCAAYGGTNAHSCKDIVNVWCSITRIMITIRIGNNQLRLCGDLCHNAAVTSTMISKGDESWSWWWWQSNGNGNGNGNPAMPINQRQTESHPVNGNSNNISNSNSNSNNISNNSNSNQNSEIEEASGEEKARRNVN